MSDEFIRANVSAALNLAVNYCESFGKKVHFIKPRSGSITTKAVIQSYNKGDFIVDLYGDLIEGKDHMQKDGLTIMAEKYRFDRSKLIDFIIDNELVLSIEEA